MSFLHQLKQEAQKLQALRGQQQQSREAQVAATEAACLGLWQCFMELPRLLNVIEPPAVAWSLDGKTPWPPMKQGDFRFDARKKSLRDKQVFDYLVLGWRIVPREAGALARARVSVNFPPELERVERRLHAGHVKHERKEQRHPETQRLQVLHFDHETAARASVLFTPDHDNARFGIRLACVNGMDIVTLQRAADEVDAALLDELARLIVGEPSRFLEAAPGL